MNLLEAIESRTLFAAAGLDTTFGHRGTLGLGAVPDGTTETFNGNTYVDAVENRRHYIYKVNESGKVDTTWGNNGRVTFGIDVQAMAYDVKTRRFYAVGVDDGTLKVKRFLANGRDDTEFGTNAIFSYTPYVQPRVSADLYYTNTVSAAGIKVLPKGQSMLVLNFESRTMDFRGFYNESSGKNELALMRLSASGQRDAGFGSRGVTYVFSGNYMVYESDLYFGSHSIKPTLGELVLRDNGTYRVVASLTNNASESASPLYEVKRRLYGLTVTSQLVSRQGALDPTAAASWEILDRGTEVKTYGVFADADSGALAVARNVTNNVQHEPAYYRLASGTLAEAAAVPVADPGALIDVVKTDRGEYLALTSAGTRRYVTKLTTTFIAPVRNGGRSLVTVNDVNSDTTFIGDYGGRVLVIDKASIRRFLFAV